MARPLSLAILFRHFAVICQLSVPDFWHIRLPSWPGQLSGRVHVLSKRLLACADAGRTDRLSHPFPAVSHRNDESERVRVLRDFVVHRPNPAEYIYDRRQRANRRFRSTYGHVSNGGDHQYNTDLHPNCVLRVRQDHSNSNR